MSDHRLGFVRAGFAAGRQLSCTEGVCLARRRFFVERTDPGRAVVRGEQAHHLHNVLRLQPGQIFELSDTRQLYLGRVIASLPGEVTFAIEKELPAGPQPPEVTLLGAIFKFDRYEWMIEKATELGAARIIPVITSRTDPKLAAAAQKRVERWRRIAFEAAQQSRRVAPPELPQPVALDSALAAAPEGRRWILEEGLEPASLSRLGPARDRASVLLIGPEGGWTEGERKMAHQCGFLPASLGPLILRAETAAIAALALLLLPAASDF
ncbi:MAG TPA: RsmE family RNA methyltransferase [Bryobacterales bacterium]|nr:RsmE family RNA methyltransferase [Bryobacterales bacterium]